MYPFGAGSGRQMHVRCYTASGERPVYDSFDVRVGVSRIDNVQPYSGQRQVTGRPPQPSPYLKRRLARELQSDVVEDGRLVSIHETHQGKPVVPIPMMRNLPAQILPRMA